MHKNIPGKAIFAALVVLAGAYGNAGVPPEGTKPLSDIHGIVPGGECPDPGRSRTADIASAASALIPLKVGLTLSSVWKGNADDYEHECLTQVTGVDARSISTKGSCPIGPRRVLLLSARRLCWTDILDSRLYLTEEGTDYAETYVGALKFSLSAASFAALKSTGEVRHRYLNLRSGQHQFVANDIDGVLKSDGAGTFKIIINDQIVEVPTIEANYVNQEKHDTIRVKVLDDARFPLMLDYSIPTLGKFVITYTKVSFPTQHGLEQHLAVDKRADVYGIYFDFASDSLRSESEPILHEIGDAMKAHPDWKLIINGHTDNIGGDAMNLDLSRRRAAAVRKALIERFLIDEARLSTSGYGASQPKESNESDRGRARNRRVELIRQ